MSYCSSNVCEWFPFTQLPLDHCPHLRAHPDQEWWRSSDAKVCRYLILQDLIWVHLPSQVPGHPDGFVDAGLLGLPRVRVNVRGESPPCPLPHPQVCLAAASFFHPLLSLATIAGYWLWFLYLKYLKMESEASKEVNFKMLRMRSKLSLVQSCNSVYTKWHLQSCNVWIDFTPRFFLLFYQNVYSFQNTCIFSKEAWVSGWLGSILLSSSLFSFSTGPRLSYPGIEPIKITKSSETMNLTHHFILCLALTRFKGEKVCYCLRKFFTGAWTGRRNMFTLLPIQRARGEKRGALCSSNLPMNLSWKGEGRVPLKSGFLITDLEHRPETCF